MADNKIAVDPARARAIQLSFKRASGGLSKEEQEELEQIRRSLDYAKKDSSSSNG